MKFAKQLGLLIAFLVTLALVNWAHRKIMATSIKRAHPAVANTSSMPLTGADDEKALSIRQVQAVIQNRCGDCHNQGGAAPFELTTYDDIAKRAEQIIEVTQSGYMPPWLPGESDFPFANDRSMPSDEVQLIEQWLNEGKPKTGFADSVPVKTDGEEAWQLGKPDLIVELPQAFELAAEGSETFWNFVLPVTLDQSKFVRTAEIKPGNLRAVHHIIGQLDRSGAAMRKQSSLGQNGFAGMEFEQGEILQGQSLLWTPGKLASNGYKGISWLLDSRTDIILQTHMFPTGKKETIKPRVGLYFAKAAPSLFPLSLMLEAPEIDIPAGESNYTVTDEFLLPVDVKVLSVYPHAHYLATKMLCVAALPDKSEYTLLHIEEWDFNWQDEYVFESPVQLPHGTLIRMEFTYDNSAHNVRNPNDPPARVVLGNSTTDEMGSLLLQVLPRNATERAVLDESRWQQKLLTAPLNLAANQNLGNILEAKGELVAARRCYQRALQVAPKNSVAHDNLANVLSLLGDAKKAEHHFRTASKLAPENALVFHHWGASLMRNGRLDEAVDKFSKALNLWPEFPEANINLGKAELLRGNNDIAKKHFTFVAQNSPNKALAHFNLGTLLMGEQDYASAKESFRRAIELQQGFAEAHNNLGISLFLLGELQESAASFRKSLELDPVQQNAKKNLEQVEKQLNERLKENG